MYERLNQEGHGRYVLTSVCPVLLDATTDIVRNGDNPDDGQAQSPTAKRLVCGRDARGACHRRWKMKDRELGSRRKSTVELACRSRGTGVGATEFNPGV